MKKLTVLMLVVVLVLGLMLIAVGARGPTNRATGEVWFTTDDGYPRHIWFDAHEAYAGRPEKGEFHQEDWCGGTYHWYNGYVINVDVDGNSASFDINFYEGNGWAVGHILPLAVVDNGEPGIGVDTVNGWPIYEGNLVVHYYEG